MHSKVLIALMAIAIPFTIAAPVPANNDVAARDAEPCEFANGCFVIIAEADEPEAKKPAVESRDAEPCEFANGCFVIIASTDDEPAAQKVGVDARDAESKLL